MTLRDLIFDVLRTLWSHKLRAFFTMFGIAWGIVSIVFMAAAGEGLEKARKDGQDLGKDIMIVSMGGRVYKQAELAPAGSCIGKSRRCHLAGGSP